MDGTPVRPMTERIGKRVKRLESLLDSDAVDIANRARKTLLVAAVAPDPIRNIRVRSGLFARFDEAETGPTRIQEVSTPKGAAVKVLLLALFELQVRKPRAAGLRPRTALALDGSTESRDFSAQLMPGWTELAALPTVDSTKVRTHARKALDNRRRQLKAALDRLAECGRVELKKPGSHGRYEKFRVLNEAITNDGQRGLTPYTVPGVGTGRTRRRITTIPVEFFLNGWIDALTDNEIITYLALRLIAQAFPDRHAEAGVFLAAEFREAAFNLDRGFEAHRMLARYGLISTSRDQRRSVHGTMRRHEKVGDGALHRFVINDDVLLDNGVERVITSLTRFAEHVDSDLASWMDVLDRSEVEKAKTAGLEGAEHATKSWFR